jgi:hypothetical protein
MPSARKNTDSGSLAATASDQIRAIIEAAEQTAAQIRADAEDEAARIRRHAKEEASGIRSEAKGDVQALVQSLRQGLASLNMDLEKLEALSAPAPDDEAAMPVDDAPAQDETPRAATSLGADARAGAPAEPDLESARLVALNMALDGAERGEVERYLSENFSLTDATALLDEVYASVGG